MQGRKWNVHKEVPMRAIVLLGLKPPVCPLPTPDPLRALQS